MAYDIYFTGTDQETQTGSGKLFTFGYASAVGVQGPLKLVNRWLHCLLTPKGTDPLAKTYGTEFALMIGANISSVDEATELCSLYIDDCNEQIKALDRSIMPASNERLQSAVIAKVEMLDPDGFKLYVDVSNAAGQKVTLPLPAIGV